MWSMGFGFGFAVAHFWTAFGFAARQGGGETLIMVMSPKTATFVLLLFTFEIGYSNPVCHCALVNSFPGAESRRDVSEARSTRLGRAAFRAAIEEARQVLHAVAYEPVAAFQEVTLAAEQLFW